MQCPKCGANMWHVGVENAAGGSIDVDRCSGCFGVFFDLNEEVRLAALKGSELVVDTGGASAEGRAKGAAHDAIRDIRCPRDDQPMISMVSLNGRVRYESCKTCFGAYFDAGEFTEFKKSNSFLDFFR